MAHTNINVQLSGLGDFEKILMSLEPEVVKEQTEALREAAKEAISEVRNKIPSGWALASNVVAYISYYKNNKIFFLSVGIGDEILGPIRKESDRRSFAYRDPLRYARWQEYGWQPEKWGMNISDTYKTGRTRWDGTPRNIDPKTGLPRRVSILKNVTEPKDFVKNSQERIIEIVEEKLREAFERKATELLSNNTRSIQPDDFTVAIDRNAMKQITKNLPDIREVIK
jgi:hypothetical protein